MWIVLAVVALIAVAAALVTMFRRPRGDDLNSVRSYHSALGTLEHLSERTVRSTVNVEDTAASPSDPVTGTRTTRRSTAGAAIPRLDPADREPRTVAGPRTTARSGGPVPPVPVRGNDEFPDPETPLIFDDSRPKDRYLATASGDTAPPARTERAQRHALDSMNHRPRRSMTVMIVVAVLVLFGVLAYVGSKRSAPTSHAKSASPTTSAAPATATRTTVAARGAGGHHAPTRTTVPPAPTRILASSSTAYSATYPVTTSSYRIIVTGTGQCWVSATAVSSGSTLWAGTVQAGTVQVIEATGATSVQLGTPAATLAINKVPVVFPTPALSPFVATFEPSAPSSAGSVTSTTAAAGSATTPSTTTTSVTTTTS